MGDIPENHDAVTVDQFTRTAETFAALHTPQADADLLALIRTASRVGSASVVLDVACGPGLIALTLAEAAGHVTGLDLTPAMLDKAREQQRQRGLHNLSWQVGRADRLPFGDGAFDAVVTRFSFHHLADPAAALAEMVRVCRPEGRVVVCDVYTTTPEQASEYDRLERLRDPSHVRALLLEEFRELMQGVDPAVEEARTGLAMNLDALLAASAPVPGGADAYRGAFAADVGRDRLGLGVRHTGAGLAFAFPVVVFAGTRVGCRENAPKLLEAINRALPTQRLFDGPSCDSPGEIP